eukprot:362057-Chlamydomonas_euryale.AAC.5
MLTCKGGTCCQGLTLAAANMLFPCQSESKGGGIPQPHTTVHSGWRACVQALQNQQLCVSCLSSTNLPGQVNLRAERTGPCLPPCAHVSRPPFQPAPPAAQFNKSRMRHAPVTMHAPAADSAFMVSAILPDAASTDNTRTLTASPEATASPAFLRNLFCRAETRHDATRVRGLQTKPPCAVVRAADAGQHAARPLLLARNPLRALPDVRPHKPRPPTPILRA